MMAPALVIPHAFARRVALLLLVLAPLAWIAGLFPEHPLVLAAALAVIAIGAIHGIHDLALLLPRGARWRPAPVAIYVAAMALTALAFWFVPAAALMGFLAISIFHFGSADALGTRRAMRWAEGVWRGLLPIVVPAAAWPDEVAALFAALSRDADLSVRLVGFFGSAISVAVVALALLATVALAAPSERRVLALEGAALTAWLYLAPPILGFAVYFGLVHSLRHWQWLARRGLLPTAALKRFRGGIALAGVAVVGLSVLVAWTGPAWAPTDPNAIGAVVFVALACVATPHALVVALAARKDR